MLVHKQATHVTKPHLAKETLHHVGLDAGATSFMDDALLVDIPPPKYEVGTIVIALINHQPRYARIEEAYLDVRLILKDDGIDYTGEPRWEYFASVFNDTNDETEAMIIAEQTIITEINAA